MRRSDTYEIPVGSTADIAFLLLIFFLMAATIETDTGILRKLPPMERDAPVLNRKKRNILIVLVNRHNELMVNGELLDIRELRVKTKEFIRNRSDADNLPELLPADVQYFGSMMTTSNHIISLCSDRGTSYEMYIAVQNELAAAYHELRDEISLGRFGVKFDDLVSRGEKEKQKAVEFIYPMKISEAEPQKQED